MSGKVYLVGAGPGDPGLLTIRGREVLQQATVVIHDYLVSEEILDYAPPEAEQIDVGKRGGHHTKPQEEINRLLCERAKAGHVVVRLKGGDPFLFGRGGEEALELAKAGIEFEVVPGVTSAIAVPAYAGIPVTHREMASELHLITGHEAPGKRETSLNWDVLGKASGTLVFLMGVGNLPTIVEQLRANGKKASTPVALIRWGTRPDQQTLASTLGKVVEAARKANFQPPAIIVVGECVGLRRMLKWYEKKPLFGKRIAVTRPPGQAQEFSTALRECGAVVYECATIQIEPVGDGSAIDQEIRQLGDYDWLIFTSVNAVDMFMSRVFGLGLDARCLAGVRVTVIGSKTGECLREYGIVADVVPREFMQEKLLESLPAEAGDRVLLPRAAEARDLLPLTLEKKGVHVEVVPLYETGSNKQGIAKLKRYLTKGVVDVMTFTSSSTVQRLIDALSDKERSRLFQDVLIASIGPVTSATARDAGLQVHIEAKEYTTRGLLEAIVKYFSKRKDRSY
jgi:uroporphyrinogen III methyltransferase/synthase